MKVNSSSQNSLFQDPATWELIRRKSIYCIVTFNFALQDRNQTRCTFLSFSVVIYNGGGYMPTKFLIPFEIILFSREIPTAVEYEIRSLCS